MTKALKIFFFCCQLCRLKVTTRWPETARCGLLLYVRSYTRTNCSIGLPWHPIKYLTVLLYIPLFFDTLLGRPWKPYSPEESEPAILYSVGTTRWPLCQVYQRRIRWPKHFFLHLYVPMYIHTYIHTYICTITDHFKLTSSMLLGKFTLLNIGTKWQNKWTIDRHC
jgi:hypothetical protein